MIVYPSPLLHSAYTAILPEPRHIESFRSGREREEWDFCLVREGVTFQLLQLATSFWTQCRGADWRALETSCEKLIPGRIVYYNSIQFRKLDFFLLFNVKKCFDIYWTNEADNCILTILNVVSRCLNISFHEIEDWRSVIIAMNVFSSMMNSTTFCHFNMI